jgi:indole-3-glycerol phosphate synthase
MKATNYLDEIIKRKHKEVARTLRTMQADPIHPVHGALKQEKAASGRFSSSLKKQGLSVIAEVKRRSPSRGKIKEIVDPVGLAMQYCLGGASAISVLTDGEAFGGSLEDLISVSKAIKEPYPCVGVLRKDFIIHPVQLAEAVLFGASAVLLIVKVLGKDLKRMINAASQMGLETLVEVHDLKELELALQADSPIIGINHRNLSTFQVDLKMSQVLRPLIPPHVITVAESGIHEIAQARQMRDLGYDAILVGETLMRSEHPAQLIKSMKGGSDDR